MACKIDGHAVTLTRGDSFIVKVGMKYQETGEEYIPQVGDEVRFALKASCNDISAPLILKDIPIDTMLLELEPDDTKPLPFGQYVYDIELTYATGKVDTFIVAAPFTIAREVH